MSKGKPIVLIAGELGAGCTEIGELIASKLGVEVYNTERFIRSMVSSPHLSFQALAAKSVSGEIELEKVLQSLVFDVVNNGPAVIEGRSALFALTREVDLKVFLYSDVEERIRHIAEKRKTEEIKQIEEDVRASDIDRSSLVERLYHRNWRDPLLYDVMVNTSKMSYEEIASFIVEVLKFKQ